jgi:predicted metal-dependent HD superfamily phosphohydrolase
VLAGVPVPPVDPSTFVELLRPWAGAAEAETLAGELLARHDEPRRSYHTGVHLAEVLAELDRLAPWSAAAASPEVRLAAWFHDAVYDPEAGAGANEEASAVLAATRLSALGVPSGVVDEVGRLVRLTAGHVVADDDPAGAAMIDADLAILAAAPDRYERYVGEVRAEYRHVPDDLWRQGRVGVLRRFAAAGRLYSVPVPDDDRDERARLNLRRELASLGG